MNRAASAAHEYITGLGALGHQSFQSGRENPTAIIMFKLFVFGLLVGVAVAVKRSATMNIEPQSVRAAVFSA